MNTTDNIRIDEAIEIPLTRPECCAHTTFELARRYGDIAMPLEVLTEEEANTIGKTPFAEVINFIVNECNEALTTYR